MPLLPITHSPKTLFLLLVAAAGLLLAACNDNGNSGAVTTGASAATDYPSGDLLISPEQLAERIDDPDLRLIDLSSIRTYREGHLPDAVHVWWQDTIEIHNEVYGMMADPDTRSELFQGAGITPDSFVVLYDEDGGRYASRFLWLLHFVGFDNVAVLQGGRQAWEAAGYGLTTDAPEVPRGDLEHQPDHDVLIGADDVEAALGNEQVLILDGRTDAERSETWYGRLRTGEIPGSMRMPRDEVIQDEDIPSFAPAERLEVMLPENANPQDVDGVIVYGMHGVETGQVYVAMRLLGYESVQVYDGSWAEWGADPERPIHAFEE